MSMNEATKGVWWRICGESEELFSILLLLLLQRRKASSIFHFLETRILSRSFSWQPPEPVTPHQVPGSVIFPTKASLSLLDRPLSRQELPQCWSGRTLLSFDNNSELRGNQSETAHCESWKEVIWLPPRRFLMLAEWYCGWINRKLVNKIFPPNKWKLLNKWQ